MVDVFGKDLVGDDGRIDRKILGSKVFGKPEMMKKLTDVVWPGIQTLINAELERLKGEGKSIVIIEAAVLIETRLEEK